MLLFKLIEHVVYVSGFAQSPCSLERIALFHRSIHSTKYVAQSRPFKLASHGELVEGLLLCVAHVRSPCQIRWMFRRGLCLSS